MTKLHLILPIVAALISNLESKSFKPLIIGGEDVEQGEFPSLVAVMVEGKFKCAGNLAKTNLIVTTATCLHDSNGPVNANLVEVIAGAHDLSSTEESLRQPRKAAKIEIHKEFDANTMKNDVAAIVLESPVTLGEGVGLIPLPEIPPTLPPTTTEASTTDAPPDTTTDAPPDTTTDAPPDTTTDAPPDTTTDAPPDTTTDAPPDTTTDAPPDADIGNRGNRLRRDIKNDLLGVTVGWGSAENGESNTPKKLTVTRKEDQKACQDKYGSKFVPGVTFCAGAPNTALCTNDEGAPFYANDVLQGYAIDHKDCAVDDIGALYASVENYVTFVEEVSEENPVVDPTSEDPAGSTTDAPPPESTTDGSEHIKVNFWMLVCIIPVLALNF